MKPAFLEDFVSPHADPLDSRTSDFDWEALSIALGESGDEMSPTDYERLGAAVKRLLHWLMDADLSRPGFENIIARKVLALAWTLDPGYFEGSPSLTAIAERVGTHKATLSSYSADASRQFNVRNRGQAHGWNFKPKAKVMRPKGAPAVPALVVSVAPRKVKPEPMRAAPRQVAMLVQVELFTREGI